ncbi:hypothetical protein SKAU_G00218340 [Synaphobranchus kaupii]|uniref:Uncharacterized protein n=1 Tax=Synaphobranchus kaupii TaxID=118154 RepID=A0A9Q1FAH6_SYNKA|nr:hypothetical protein SKAU_G00218340 [Synaphobranchus kaupii]
MGCPVLLYPVTPLQTLTGVCTAVLLSIPSVCLSITGLASFDFSCRWNKVWRMWPGRTSLGAFVQLLPAKRPTAAGRLMASSPPLDEETLIKVLACSDPRSR